MFSYVWWCLFMSNYVYCILMWYHFAATVFWGAVWLEWMQMGRRERFNIRSKSLSQAQQTIWAAEQSYRPQWTKRQVGDGEWGKVMTNAGFYELSGGFSAKEGTMGWWEMMDGSRMTRWSTSEMDLEIRKSKIAMGNPHEWGFYWGLHL